jgi:putative ABC transport system permease protein
VGVLALGVGANSALVGVVHAVLVKPLPYVAPDQLYSVEIVVPERTEQFPSMPVSVLAFQRWREGQTAFSDIGALTPWEVNLAGGDGEPERLGGARVSANFFRVLGSPIALGRSFDRAEEQPGRERVVVISDALWRRRYGADPAVIGRTIRISEVPHEIVGVASPSLLVPTSNALHPLIRFASRIDVWKPIAPAPGRLNQTSWDHGVLVRLADRNQLETGRGQLAGMLNEMVREDLPGLTTTGAEIRLVRIRDVYAGRVRLRLLLVLAAAALLLMTACTSIVDLLIARVVSRAHEFATRAALGATRPRIAGQVLAEVAVLAALGGLAAAAVADLGVRALALQGPDDVRVLAAGAPGPWLWLFAFGASLAAGLACALPTALQASRPQALALRELSRHALASRRAGRHRRVMVGVQMTVATILLSVSALLLHSFVRLSMADRGYETEGVLTVDLSLFGARYGTAEQRIAFYDDLRERVGALPGVTTAGAINYLPALSAAEGASRTIYREDDRPPFQALMLTRPIAMLRSVTPGYFAASGTPLRAGRLFSARETELVCLLSESLAEQLWPQEPASRILGRRVRQAGDPSAPLVTVVGVVGDVQTGAMDGAAPLSYYRPYPQWASGPMALIVRTGGNPESLVPAVRSVIRAMDADLPIAAIRTMQEVVQSTVSERRFQLTVTMLFAIVALLVGAIGLYGVVTYSVACRTNEIGLRIALGAARRELMRWIFFHGLVPVAVGLVVGLSSAVTIAVTLRSLLFEISPADPLSLAAVAGVLLATSSLACYLPARRAAMVDPMTALRQNAA